MDATRKLRRARVLIVGCGDVGMRCVPLLTPRARVFALTSDASRVPQMRAAGVSPIVGNLDERRSLARLAHLAPTVLHLAPPPRDGDHDTRTRALLATLSAPVFAPVSAADSATTGTVTAWRLRAARPMQTFVGHMRRVRATSSFQPAGIVPDGSRRTASRRRPVRVVYASTTGVYGDCGGARIDETQPVAPANARAKRRVSAERQMRAATVRGVVRASIARIPGIYAANRLPLARLEKGTPALAEADDVYTNHIHADDLAMILVRMALHPARAKPCRVIHASDDTVMKMGAYFDVIADAYGLPRAPRITRAEAEARIDPMMLSFMRESRRLMNHRLVDELGARLRYPHIEDFLRAQGKLR